MSQLFLLKKAYQQWAKDNPSLDKRLPGLKQFSPEQMFFIGFAHGWCAKMTDAYALNRVLTDVHSVAQFRYLSFSPPLSLDKTTLSVSVCWVRCRTSPNSIVSSTVRRDKGIVEWTNVPYGDWYDLSFRTKEECSLQNHFLVLSVKYERESDF